MDRIVLCLGFIVLSGCETAKTARPGAHDTGVDSTFSDARPQDASKQDTGLDLGRDAQPLSDIGPDTGPDAQQIDAQHPDAASDAALDSEPLDSEPLDSEPLDMAALDATTDAELDAAQHPDLGAVVDAFVWGDVDFVDFECVDPDWAAGACVPGVGLTFENRGNDHVREDLPIVYNDPLPASGPHRPMWGRWGEYSWMPPQRWLHNLEHGGIALLYNPCAPAEVIDALREIARAHPADDRGEFRWILTPYVGLSSAVAIVAWQWTYQAECVRLDEIELFISQHYRQAGEDVQSDGRFDVRFLGR